MPGMRMSLSTTSTGCVRQLRRAAPRRRRLRTRPRCPGARAARAGRRGPAPGRRPGRCGSRQRSHAGIGGAHSGRLASMRSAPRARGRQRQRAAAGVDALAHAGQAVAVAQRAAHAAVVLDRRRAARPPSRRSATAHGVGAGVARGCWSALPAPARSTASAMRRIVDAHVVVDRAAAAPASASARPARAARCARSRPRGVAQRLHHVADVAEQFGRQLLRDAQLRRAAANAGSAASARRLRVMRGELVAGDVVQLARHAQAFGVARALGEQRARRQQVGVDQRQLVARPLGAHRVVGASARRTPGSRRRSASPISGESWPASRSIR